MARLISCAITKQQVIARTKDVTRRENWTHAKPGDLLWFVDKAMGLKFGEKVHKRALIRILSMRREPLGSIDQTDVIREGFPDKDPEWFIDMFIKTHPKTKSPDDIVTRIEYEYLDPPFVMKHKPTKEEWWVLGIDYESQRVRPAGWPSSFGALSDCKIIEVVDRELNKEEIGYTPRNFLPLHLRHLKG